MAKDMSFSPWLAWELRGQLEGATKPGVYVLGLFPGGPPRRVDLLDDRIVYVGETCGQTLQKRWWQFDRSAFQEKPGHSGGWTYRDSIGATSRGLHVSALPVSFEEQPLHHAQAYIRYIERKLIWEFVQRHHRMPTCNSK